MTRTGPARRSRLVAAGALALALVVILVVLATPKGDPGRLRDEVRSAIAARRWDRAEAALAGLERLRAPIASDWLLHARVDSARGRDDAALLDLGKIPGDHPDAPEALQLAGTIELHRLRLRPAEAAFRRALELDPRLSQPRWGLAMIATLQMRRDGVFEAFRVLAGQVPLNFDQALLWTQVHCSSWDPDKVVPQLRKSLAADPGDPRVRLALAEGLRQLGRREESREVLESLSATDPDALALRAWLALDLGEEWEAGELLAGGPADHAELALLRGRLALLRRDGPSAVAQFRAALKAMPDRREGLWGLAQSLRLVGRDQEAEALAGTVRRLDDLSHLVQAAKAKAGRDDPKLIRDLGAACESLGLLAEAHAWYALAVARDPTDPQGQAALRRLDASGR